MQRGLGGNPHERLHQDKASDPTLNSQVFYRGRWFPLSVAFPPRSLMRWGFQISHDCELRANFPDTESDHRSCAFAATPYFPALGG
ncbi:hypothetical protein [Moorena bouillonii]|uniref:hypothetical protein n=1 Tax=Moorena bouillonii TaxID=207920 RepID=UPI0018E921EC|nr:hypothetical protein [Moorena bouillonii]